MYVLIRKNRVIDVDFREGPLEQYYTSELAKEFREFPDDVLLKRGDTYNPATDCFVYKEHPKENYRATINEKLDLLIELQADQIGGLE